MNTNPAFVDSYATVDDRHSLEALHTGLTLQREIAHGMDMAPVVVLLNAALELVSAKLED
jgi:hypothetical protein